MKQIRDLEITTKEGFSVKNLKRFPSMEYGENGGVEADVYYNGDLIMTVFDEGNGGCAITYTKELYNLKKGEINGKALTCLKRLDKNWDKYDWLKEKTPKDIDDDDWLGIVNIIEDYYDDYKQVKKAFKDGYKTIAVLSNDFQKAYLRYRVGDITIKEVEAYLNAHNLTKTYPDIYIINDLAKATTI